MLKELRAFGVLITPVGNRTAAIQEIRRLGTPVVLVDREASRMQCSLYRPMTRSAVVPDLTPSQPGSGMAV